MCFTTKKYIILISFCDKHAYFRLNQRITPLDLEQKFDFFFNLQELM
jgi:hypothetical protein